jgi:hypothetical protein
MAAMKRSGEKTISGATGAPTAGFLSALDMEAPIHYCITANQAQWIWTKAISQSTSVAGAFST